MLEKPDLSDETILAAVQTGFNLDAVRLAFLPLGADVNTAVYRLETAEGAAYFLKLRKGAFEQITVALPAYLASQGLSAVIPPLGALSGQLWSTLGEYRLILYPFVEGQDGYQVELSDRQWMEYGAALKALHTTSLPPELARQVPHERFDGRWREMVKDYQQRVERQTFSDPSAAGMAGLMRSRQADIRRIVARSEELAFRLRETRPDFVLCHADIHPGNLHIGVDRQLYIVDWDNPRYALKELDLMFAGGTQSSPHQDTRAEALFYQGYGPVQVNRSALAYYRYQRIIEDIAAFGMQLLDSSEGAEDRQQSLLYFSSYFLPGQGLEIALQTDSRG